MWFCQKTGTALLVQEFLHNVGDHTKFNIQSKIMKLKDLVDLNVLCLKLKLKYSKLMYRSFKKHREDWILKVCKYYGKASVYLSFQSKTVMCIRNKKGTT